MCKFDIFVPILQICILNFERLSNLFTLTYLEKHSNWEKINKMNK